MVKSTGNTAAALPEGVRRDYLLELIEKLRHELQLSANSIIYLRTIARKTAHADWYNPSCDGPRCYVKQSDLAAEVNITRRSANRIEGRLEALGLIKIIRAENHHRSGSSAIIGVTGIFLTPMISLLSVLQKMLDEKERRYNELKTERARASCAKASLRKMLNENSAIIPFDLLDEARTLLDTLPSRVSQLTSVVELQDISYRAREMTSMLTGNLSASLKCEDAEVASIAAKLHHDESHAEDASVTLHTHNTPDNIKVKSNAENEEGTSETETQKLTSEKRTTNHDLRQPNNELGTARKTTNVSVEMAYSAASTEFQYYVDATHGGPPTTEGIKFAADMRRRELLVSDQTWNAAGELMGYPTRAIALLILDRNRSHPTHPVRSPGGALLGMARKARTSELHLAKSLMGIMKRNTGSRSPETDGLRHC